MKNMLLLIGVTINTKEKIQTILFLTKIDFQCENQDFTIAAFYEFKNSHLHITRAREVTFSNNLHTYWKIEPLLE